MKHMDGGMAQPFLKYPGWALRRSKNRVMLYGLTWDYDARPALEKIQVPCSGFSAARIGRPPTRRPCAIGRAQEEGQAVRRRCPPPARTTVGVVFRVEKGQRIITGFPSRFARTQANGWPPVAGGGSRDSRSDSVLETEQSPVRHEPDERDKRQRYAREVDPAGSGAIHAQPARDGMDGDHRGEDRDDDARPTGA